MNWKVWLEPVLMKSLCSMFDVLVIIGIISSKYAVGVRAPVFNNIKHITVYIKLDYRKGNRWHL